MPSRLSASGKTSRPGHHWKRTSGSGRSVWLSLSCLGFSRHSPTAREESLLFPPQQTQQKVSRFQKKLHALFLPSVARTCALALSARSRPKDTPLCCPHTPPRPAFPLSSGCSLGSSRRLNGPVRSFSLLFSFLFSHPPTQPPLPRHLLLFSSLRSLIHPSSGSSSWAPHL